MTIAAIPWICLSFEIMGQLWNWSFVAFILLMPNKLKCRVVKWTFRKWVADLENKTEPWYFRDRLPSCNSLNIVSVLRGLVGMQIGKTEKHGAVENEIVIYEINFCSKTKPNLSWPSWHVRLYCSLACIVLCFQTNWGPQKPMFSNTSVRSNWCVKSEANMKMCFRDVRAFYAVPSSRMSADSWP